MLTVPDGVFFPYSSQCATARPDPNSAVMDGSAFRFMEDLGRLEDRFTNRLRNGNRQKKPLGVEIIVA
jgi:hypothetical protein